VTTYLYLHSLISAAECFSSLMINEWKDNITSVALFSLEASKFNKINLIPHTSDLVVLNKFLLAEMDACMEQYDDEEIRPTLGREWFRRLSRVVLADLTIFNKRRGNEVARIHVKSYHERPDWRKGINEEIKSTFTPVELELMDR